MERQLTKEQSLEFKKWLLDEGLTIAEFAKKCNVSRQYISRIVHGDIAVTEHVKELFKKGGYKL